jgi:hypothetical protein
MCDTNTSCRPESTIKIQIIYFPYNELDVPDHAFSMSCNYCNPKKTCQKRRKNQGAGMPGSGDGWDSSAECTGRRAKKKATGSGLPVAEMPRPQGPAGPADWDWIEGRMNR